MGLRAIRNHQWGSYENAGSLLHRRRALANLIAELRQQLRAKRIPGSFAVEVDLIIDEHRLVKGDACFMSPADRKKQSAEAKVRGKPNPDRARIYVPPTIVIESISPGHLAHDRVTKFGWYTPFGVAHYWLLDAHKRTLEAFVLENDRYRQVAKLAKKNALFRPVPFPSIKIDLTDVWPARL